MKEYDGIKQIIVTAIALSIAIFHIYTGLFGTILTQKIVHLTLVMMLAFLIKPMLKSKKESNAIRIINTFLVLLSLLVGGYLAINYINLTYSIGDPSNLEIVLGIVIVLLVLELTRRTMGWPLVIIALIFIAYSLFGQYLPGLLKHRGFGISRIVTYLYLSSDGIFGPALAATAEFVILFVILGSFLEASGVGEYFMTMASSIFSSKRGGPAKIAVFSSALYGTVSGSSTANVVTTGAFTIPLMIRTGYDKEYAGAVEAVASTGGQLMPPIMGSVAFVLAEIVGCGYNAVIKAAIIPAILYYISCYFMVDMRAQNIGLTASKQSVNWSSVIKGLYLLSPIAILVYFISGLNLSLMRSAVLTIISTIAISWIKKDTRIGLKKLKNALLSGAKGALVVATASACAGIVIGIINLTGLGLRFSGIIISLSGGNIIIALVLAMICCIILGMGLPTLASYLIMSVIAAPALVKLGLDTLAVHLFVMYFACLSSITPPVALAAYAAAGISGGDVWKTGWTAVRVGITGFIVPYMFIYNPNIMMNGTVVSIIQSFVTSIIGIYCLAASIENRFLGLQVNKIIRIILLLVSILLIDPGTLTDVIGIGSLIAFAVLKFTGKYKLLLEVKKGWQ